MARAARTDDAVSGRLQAWSADVPGDDVSAALEEFVGDDRFMDDEDIALFTTWFHNDRQLSGGGTPAERYAARAGLPEDERETATRIAAAQLGLHRVLASEAGRTLTLEPILGGARFEVTSPYVSGQVALWDIVLTRVMPGDPLSLSDRPGCSSRARRSKYWRSSPGSPAPMWHGSTSRRRRAPTLVARSS